MKALQVSHKHSPKKEPKKRSPNQPSNIPPAKRPKPLLVEDSSEKKSALVWVDKYKPLNLKQLIGQHGDRSPANKLLDWLKNWARYHLSPQIPGEKKKGKTSFFQAQQDGSAFKAALVSGPPGIGKTTCAILCCKELGLAYVEMNASDVRNKAAIDKHAQQLTSNQIEKYFKIVDGQNENLMSSSQPAIQIIAKKSPIKQGSNNQASKETTKVHNVLIMDEVDGMSGNADRAGIAELIQMIKRTKVPLICICNDRQSKKIRSLANYCYDLRFQRPRADQIKARLMSIAAKERITIPKEQLDKVIEASNQDIRQCINALQMMSGPAAAPKQIQKKDITVNIFEAARQILSTDTNLRDKTELYFTDYSLMPLFVQENYPNVRASKMSKLDHLHAIAQAADSIAYGDIIDRQVRSYGNWNLLNEHAMFSCALPSIYMDGYMTAQIQFPSFFGKYSNAQKRQRLMRQLALHTHFKTSGSNQALVQDYLSLLRDRLYRPLVKNENAGVKEVLAVYNHYNLLKEDTEAINELGVWPIGNKQKDLASLVSTKTKSALTRALNKEKRILPFSQPSQIVKTGRRKGGAGKVKIKNEEEDGESGLAEADGEEEAVDAEESDMEVEYF